MNRSRHLALLIGVASLHLADGAAASIGTITLAHSASPVDGTDIKEATATCPAGSIAFSGGATLAGLPVPYSSRFLLHQSVPLGDPPSSWYVLAQEHSPSGDPWGISSWALCAERIDGYELVSAVGAADSETPKSLAVSCPAGKVPIGGGGGIYFFTSNLGLYSLLPTSTGWQVRGAERFGQAANWLVAVSVSCAPQVDVSLVDVLTTNYDGQDDFDTVSAGCPANRRYIGGGGLVEEGNALFASGPGGLGWRAGGLRTVGIGAPTGPWFVGGRALCLLLPLFADGFESGDTSAWSATVP